MPMAFITQNSSDHKMRIPSKDCLDCQISDAITQQNILRKNGPKFLNKSNNFFNLPLNILR